MPEFHIVVCLKQILDPEIPAREFSINPQKCEAERGTANLVTNIFCENALETALQFKEKHGGKVTVISFGQESVEDSLRKALAMKADDAVMVTDDLKTQNGPLFVSNVLAKAIQRQDKVDLVLTGRESGDWGQGQTGGLIAEILDLPCISFVDSIETDPAGLRVRRQTDSGLEFFSAGTPIVLTITNNEFNVPRIPKTRDVMMSYRQPLTKVNLSELRLDNAAEYYEIKELRLPQKETDCEFVTGETLGDRVEMFAQKIIFASRAA